MIPTQEHIDKMRYCSLDDENRLHLSMSIDMKEKMHEEIQDA